jgi:hypothetical protein
VDVFIIKEEKREIKKIEKPKGEKIKELEGEEKKS